MIYFATKDDIGFINNVLKRFNTKITKFDFDNNPFSKYIIVREDVYIGLLIYSVKYELAEIEYLFINEEYRNQKYAQKLLDMMLKDLKNSNVESITLEVKKSNVKAINLYKKNKFNQIALRKNYYKNEDGLLMGRKLM